MEAKQITSFAVDGKAVNFVCISSMLLYLSAFHLHNAA